MRSLTHRGEEEKKHGKKRCIVQKEVIAKPNAKNAKQNAEPSAKPNEEDAKENTKELEKDNHNG